MAIFNNSVFDSNIARTDMTFSRDNPSPRYRQLQELYRTAHEEGINSKEYILADQTFPGDSLNPHLKTVHRLVKSSGATSLLDYGAGKGSAYQLSPISVDGQIADSVKAYWGLETLVCYDPGFAPFSTLPTGEFDGVICTDVLEHIPDSDIPWILREQFCYGKKFVFGNIASFPATKTLRNGENAHCTIEPCEWWENRISDAHRATGSSADYFFVIETKVVVKKLFGLRSKLKSHYEVITNRLDWHDIEYNKNHKLKLR